MNLLKFVTKSLFVALVLLSGVVVSAETAPQKANVVVLAKINAQNPKIISQDGGRLNLSFVVSNREGAQSGVRYGVRLEKMEGKKAVVVDEYVYDEVLSVGANTNFVKTVEYNAPANLEGKYNIYIVLKNYSGLSLGVAKFGEVSLSTPKEFVQIIPESCVVFSRNISSGKIGESIAVEKVNDLSLNCKVKNNSKEKIEIKPSFETFYNSIYGEKVDHFGGKEEKINLEPQEEKAISFLLPKANTPQNYVVKVSFEKGKISSNYVLVNYSLSGVSATIRNVSLDKNSYKAKETARLALFWSSSLKKEQATSVVSLNASILNDKQVECATLQNRQLAAVGFVEIPVSLNKDCENPKVAVELKDLDGNVLDKKALVFEGAEKMSKAAPIERKTLIVFGAFALLVVLASLVAFVRIKSKKDEAEKTSSNVGPTLMAILFFVGVSLIPSGFAKADTYASGDGLILNANVPSSVTQNSQSSTQDLEVVADVSCLPSSTCSYSDTFTTVEIRFPINQTSHEAMYTPIIDDALVQAYSSYSSSLVGSVPSALGAYTVKVYWDVYYQSGAHAARPFVGDISYSIVPPPSLNVYATLGGVNYEDSVTITAGQSIDIRWKVTNVSSSTVCTCSGQSCRSSTGEQFDFFNGGTFTPATTTTYTVSCQ